MHLWYSIHLNDNLKELEVPSIPSFSLWLRLRVDEFTKPFKMFYFLENDTPGCFSLLYTFFFNFCSFLNRLLLYYSRPSLKKHLVIKS